jgi:hypothetical protein
MSKKSQCCDDNTECCDDKLDKECCIDVPIDVEKNILAIYRAPTGISSFSTDENFLRYNAFILSYEIVIRNRSKRRITNVSVRDSLWGFGLTEINTGTQTDAIAFFMSASSCCSNLAVRENGTDIVNACGELTIPSQSSLEPCSSCTILVELSFIPRDKNPNTGHPEPELVRVPYLLNTVTITGKLGPSGHCNQCKSGASIIPIFFKSEAYEDPNLYWGQGSGALGNTCNYKLCVPYSNTRCKRVTCPRPRPK